VQSRIARADPTAAVVAQRVLSGVGTRFDHSARVMSQAEKVQSRLPPPWRSALLDAAWLHDLGYSDEVAETGFHPLDGARWLRQRGWAQEVCQLVAWHSRSRTEAQLRGLADELEAEFAAPPVFVQAAMAWADMTSSPAGDCCTLQERLAEILRRYPPGSLVYKATVRNTATLCGWAQALDSRLSVPGPVDP
jgi:hypothetical protein